VLALAATADAAQPAHYYVSLGDSLAAGYQPDAHADVPEVSYTDQLYLRLKAPDPTLRHVRFGCSGETTTTMIDGGKCAYAGAASPEALPAALRAAWREGRARWSELLGRYGGRVPAAFFAELDRLTERAGPVRR
jgi:hypothetical protein